MDQKPIRIDVVSDVACPWCYVGKRRLEKALDEWKGSPVEVEWHPFQLDPSMRSEGFDRDTYLINKFGSLERTKEMTDRLIAAGKAEDISFDFGNRWLAVNTLHLHQLLHVAGEEDFKSELKERFLKAYFEECLHLNDVDVLSEILSEFGWSAQRVQEIIDDEEIAKTVKDQIAHHQQLGISGVPFFIINNKYGISGAQPSEVFLEAFSKVSPIEIISEGESCDPTTGDC